MVPTDKAETTMSDSDLQPDAEAVEADGYGDIPYPEDEPVDAVEETEEEPIGDATEEASEDGEPEQAPPDEDVPDWLGQLPEEHREAARKYAHTHSEKRVSDLKSSWQQKLDDGAEYRKTVEAFDRRLREDPAGLIADLQTYIPKAPAEPEGPGEMPDPISEPGEFAAWMKTSLEFARQSGIQQVRTEIAPALNLAQQQAQYQQRQAIKQALQADDSMMAEISALEAEIKKAPEAGYRTLKELVTLRRQLAGTAQKKKSAISEALAGSEEKSGLPRTGAARPRPKPTGDPMGDTIAELAHEGIKYPGD